MQVFVPYPEPIKVAAVLDHGRLLKQVDELMQILDAIAGIRGKKMNHPIVKMYEPHFEWLDRYRMCLSEYVGGRPESAAWWSRHADLVRPGFLTEEFCDQHKRRLYTKDPVHYALFEKYGKTDENWYFVDGKVCKYVDGKEVSEQKAPVAKKPSRKPKKSA